MNAITLLALGYGCSLAAAQGNTTSQYSVFTNTFLSDYVAGATYPIAWTVGDGKPVTLTLGNSSWSEVLLASQPPQELLSVNWTVPSNLSLLSTYLLTLTQDGPGDASPTFTITGTTMQNASMPMPMNATTVAYAPPCNATGSMMATSTFYDSECGCTKTGSALVAATPSSYYEPTCGCTKTSMVPLATNRPGAANYSLLPVATPIAPSPSHGAASQISASLASLFALLGSVLALSLASMQSLAFDQ